jgi:agarase
VATLAVAVLVIGLGPASATATTATPPALDGGFDQYGGWNGTSLGATGAFRTAQVDGRWWLVDPDGHPFFSNGVNHVVAEGTVDRNGRAAYHEAIVAKYGSDEAWAQAQTERFDEWGVNTLGGWSDDGLFAGKGVPYTAMFGFAGYGGGRVADFWDPGWATSVQAQADDAAARYAGDPWLVGYFLDNEVPWTDDWRKGPFVGFFGRGAAEPGKQHLVSWLRARYGDDFGAFAADFATTAGGWSTLGDATEAAPRGPGAQATKDAWSGEVARRFFSVTGDALATADPQHLDLGVRFVGQLITPEVLEAAGDHVDVVSVNWYQIKDEWKSFIPSLGADFLPTDDTLAAHRALVDKPFLISEFGWRARDSGLPNTYPPLQVVVEAQQDRADSYRNFGACLVNTGDVVGAHWFEMTDEPAIGRFDGEDDNWGMVDEADDAYDLVVQAAAAVHDDAYAPLAEPGAPDQPCTPISDRPAEPPPATTTTSAPTATGSTGSMAGAPVTSTVPEAGEPAGGMETAAPAQAVPGTGRYTG